MMGVDGSWFDLTTVEFKSMCSIDQRLIHEIGSMGQYEAGCEAA